MTSKKKILANQRNARKSTGPRTAAGKAKSSLNALQHGLRAQTAVLPSEDAEEFDRIHAAYEREFEPQNASEQFLVDALARAAWKIQRAERVEANLHSEDLSASALIPLKDRLSQTQSRLQRDWNRALKTLEEIKAARQKKPAAAQPAKSKPPEPPTKVQVTWVDRAAGKTQFLGRFQNGLPVDHFDE